MPADVQAGASKIASVNPATGEILREFEAADQQQVDAIVARARSAQPAWDEGGVHRRASLLRKFQRLLHEKKTEVARIITREAGKPVGEALLTEVLVVLDAARFCMQNAQKFLRREPVPHGNLAMKTKVGHVLRQPYGVVGIISPWNYPFSTPATETLGALVTGNAVVLKPSEFTSMVALELARLLHEAGVPKDVLQVVVGDGSTGSALVSADIDKLIFTGSVGTGKRIAQSAAARLLPVVLELGGKDPMLVLDNADVEVASSGAVWGAFMNAGQACLSVERCYVHRSLYEHFVQACVRKTGQLRLGNGLDPDTDVGPMIHERQLRIVEAQVEDAVTSGARVLIGGQRFPTLGSNFYAPTVLVNVNHNMKIMREETFGPVLPIMPFDDDDEAIRLANDSDYGLGASVWTRTRARGESVASRIQAGTVMINDCVSCFGISEALHGGVKASGLGRTHGHFGLEEMVRVKYVDVDLLGSKKKSWWYGYGEKFTRQMEGVIDLMFARKWAQRLRGARLTAGTFRLKNKL
jgi:acyl-CoA reductase-like NAD-dependent aldehyde dehydrogenase